MWQKTYHIMLNSIVVWFQGRRSQCVITGNAPDPIVLSSTSHRGQAVGIWIVSF